MSLLVKGVVYIILSLVSIFAALLAVNFISKLKDKGSGENINKIRVYIFLLIVSIAGIIYFVSNIPVLR